MNKTSRHNPTPAIRICLLCAALFAVWSTSAQGLTVATKDVKCKGDENGEATVNGGAAPQPYKYKWSHNAGASGRTVQDLKAGTHHVTVTDANGCTAVVDFEIKEPKQKLSSHLVFTDPHHDFCNNTFEVRVTAFGQGGTPPYSWPEGRSKLITAPGRYCFITFDQNGCFDIECTTMAEAISDCRGSVDPNDITGLKGFGDLQWTSTKTRHEYMIRYENDPELATGPAQYVEIRHDIDPHINPLSVRLGTFGFGPFLFNIPENTSFYQKRLNLINELGIYVDVVGGLDVVANQVFWKLESIDPLTGLRPLDLTIGFLPPNDTLTNDGQGFVTFSVLPKATAQTRDTVNAEAIIIFDSNEPIPTNLWTNTLDAVAPTSALQPLPDTSETTCNLSWTGSDDPTGSGIASYNLYVSVNSGAYTVVQQGITGNTYSFAGSPGNSYGFYVVAVDNTGNTEMKSIGETSTLIRPDKDIVIAAPLSVARCVSDTLTIKWTAVLIDSVDLYISYDSGQSFALIDTLLPQSASPYLWAIPDSATGSYCQIRLSSVQDAVDRMSPLFPIYGRPAVDAGADLDLCINAYTNVIASGALFYEWTPQYNISTPGNYKSLVFPDTTTTYYVHGVDAHGCSNTDSVVVHVLPTFRDTVLAEICDGDSILVGGAYQTEAGYYLDELAASTGCDSNVVTQVVITGPCPFPSPVVYVDKDAVGLNNGTSWSNAFKDLQDGLAAVEQYFNVHEIWIAEGIYYPSSEGSRDISFVLRDSVMIYGGFIGNEDSLAERTSDPSLVMISGDIGVMGDSTDNAFHVVKAESNCVDCLLDGVTVRFGQADFIFNQGYTGAGILNEGTIKLDNCIIERNTSTLEGSAIYSSGATANISIKDCIFRLNTSGLERDILNADGAQIHFYGLNQIQN